MGQRIDPSDTAKRYRETLRDRVRKLKTPLTLVGFLVDEAGTSGPSYTYADYTRVGCEDVGIRFDLRRVNKLEAERAIDAANADKNVHGIIVYYPVFGTEQDRYVKDLVAIEKDIEGLNAHWVRKLYHNQRFIDDARTKKAILPCTPLAVVKLLEAAGLTMRGDPARGGEPLKGKTITIFNRSEVVGRPLASMLANDGADVYSFDLDGPVLFKREHVVRTDATRAEALARADVVITGVPSRDFPLVKAHEIRASAIAVNFSTFKNFDDEAAAKARIFIPRVGPMTVAMALRNTLRLFENYHGA